MTAMRRVSGLIQFLVGFLLGVALFVGGLSLAGYLVFNRFAAKPEKPVFPEEQPKTEEKAEASTETETEPEAQPSPDEEPRAAATPEPTPTPTPTPSPSPTMPPNAYEARVVWSGSLNVREEPSKSSQPVTSIRYRDKVIVLENQGEWSKIQIGLEGPVGYVRSGNLEKISE